MASDREQREDKGKPGGSPVVRADDMTNSFEEPTRAVEEGAEASPNAGLQPGDAIGHYTVQARISAGAFGTVYAARHRVLGRAVAIKVLHREWSVSPVMLQRFLGEAQAVNKIRHPNIVDIFEFEMLDDGSPYLIMELLEGRSLKQLVMEQGSLTPAECLDLLTPVCDALSAAHEAGVVHRDIKGSNIIVAHPGLPWRVKLVDFGVAKLVAPDAPNLTQTGVRIGTPTAMAPEQVLGRKVDGRTDVYAIGVLLYFMLAGRAPFSCANRLKLERMHLEAPIPRISKLAPVGPTLDQIIFKCLAKKPEERYESVDAFRLDLEKAVKEHAAVGSDRLPAIPEGGHESGQVVTQMASSIYVSLLVDGDVDDDEIDDDVLDDIDQVLDIVEDHLQEAEYSLPLRTGTSLLGCRVLGDGDEQEEQRGEAIELAKTIASELAERDDAQVHVNVSVHCGAVKVREGTGGVVGGSSIRPGDWAPTDPVEGIWVSKAAAEGIDEVAEEGEEAHGGLVLASDD